MGIRSQPHIYSKVKSFAKTLSALTGCSFYLVGSFVGPKNWRDIDLYGVMDNDKFEELFGNVGAWKRQGTTGRWGAIRHRWSLFCTILSKWGTEYIGEIMDIQIYPRTHFDWKKSYVCVVRGGQ